MATLIDRLTQLVVGRRPQWTVQGTTTGPPTSVNAGVSLVDAPRALLSVDMRADITSAQVRTYTIPTLLIDPVSSWALIVDGHAIRGGDDDVLTAAALAAAVQADPDISAIVTATADGDDLTLTGDGGWTSSLRYHALSGATVHLDATGDATTARARLWLMDRDRQRWGVAVGEWVLDWRGMRERIDCAGYARAYVEVWDADGDVTVAIGPAGLEEA